MSFLRFVPLFFFFFSHLHLRLFKVALVLLIAFLLFFFLLVNILIFSLPLLISPSFGSLLAWHELFFSYFFVFSFLFSPTFPDSCHSSFLCRLRLISVFLFSLFSSFSFPFSFRLPLLTFHPFVPSSPPPNRPVVMGRVALARLAVLSNGTDTNDTDVSATTAAEQQEEYSPSTAGITLVDALLFALTPANRLSSGGKTDLQAHTLVSNTQRPAPTFCVFFRHFPEIVTRFRVCVLAFMRHFLNMVTILWSVIASSEVIF